MSLGSVRYRTQQGLSMVEVLVAVVILAIGLLGIASTQLVALEQTNMAQKRTTATSLVQEMADRVRANNGEPFASVPPDLQRRMDEQLGEEADLETEMGPDGQVLEITLEWKERDRFEEDGSRTETFTMRARMNNG